MPVGAKPILRIAAWPGFNVTGKLIPDTVKPAPIRVTPLIVTGTAPVDAMVTGCGVAVVFTVTLPNARLVVLRLSMGSAAVNCRAKACEAPFALAVSVTV
jgi:hypothetical protein